MTKILGLGAVVVALVSLLVFFPVIDWLQAAVEWIQVNRSFSWPLFILLYAAATVFMLPGSVLTLAAGFIFGLGQGFAIVSFSSVLGASLAFLTGRYFARDWVSSKLDTMPKFRALDAAIGQQSALVVFLTRLSPLFPYNLLNYALGLTQVKFSTYVLMSWIGMMPGTLLYVYLGYAGSDLASLFSGDVADSTGYGTYLFYFGLAASAVLVVWIARFSSRMLESQLDAQDTEEASADDAIASPAEEVRS